MVIALGSNMHIFARPHRRQELAWCFETVLGCGPVATVEHPGIEQPMLLVRFPGGGNLSIEFTDAAPDDDQPRLGAWLELRADEPAEVLNAALEAGLTRVEHPRPPVLLHGPRWPGIHDRASQLNAMSVRRAADTLSHSAWHGLSRAGLLSSSARTSRALG